MDEGAVTRSSPAIESRPARTGGNWLSAAWGAVSGIAPHVLHHVGPLAGAALLAGAGGQVIFFVVGLAVAAPMLIRLYRRFRSWVAPAVAVGIFAVTYTLSTFVIGPLITGEDSAPAPVATTTLDEHGHSVPPDSQ